MIKKIIATGILSFLLLLSACKLEEPTNTTPTAGATETQLFSRLYALGDNMISGYQNGVLADTLQRYGFVNLIQIQTNNEDNFIQPLIAFPGLGSEYQMELGMLQLHYLDDPKTPNTVVPDPVVIPLSFNDYPGFEPEENPYIDDDIRNYPVPYSNLGIVGSIVGDILKAKTKEKSLSRSPAIDLVLRNPDAGNYTPIQQVRLSVPSLVFLWSGTYDVLGYAQYTSSMPNFDQPTSQEKFRGYYKGVLDSLLNRTQAYVVAANIPDILDFPYFNNISPYIVDSTTNTPYLDNNGQPVPYIGVDPETDLLAMPAKHQAREGKGIPVGIFNGTGEEMPQEFVLTAEEITIINEAIAGYNETIEFLCDSVNIPMVDMYNFFKEIKTTGYSVAGIEFDARYITGNFYSLDGIHPSIAGQALVANEWIRVINDKIRANGNYLSIPSVDIMSLIHTLPLRY